MLANENLELNLAATTNVWSFLDLQLVWAVINVLF